MVYILRVLDLRSKDKLLSVNAVRWLFLFFSETCVSWYILRVLDLRSKDKLLSVNAVRWLFLFFSETCVSWYI